MAGKRVPIDIGLSRHLAPPDPRGCIEWTGTRNTKGYGRIARGGVNGRFLMAHRVAYELARGPIPEGLQLDHLCRNRLCCNPDHLEPVTRQENVARGRAPNVLNA